MSKQNTAPMHCHLCKLAGLPPIGVICELVNDDGTVMRGPQVSAFAEQHGLMQVSVADLIAYRQRQETLVERVASFDIDTPGGSAKAHAYTLPWEAMQHVAIVFGDIRDGVDIPVRLHTDDVVTDVFGKETAPEPKILYDMFYGSVLRQPTTTSTIKQVCKATGL